MSMRIGVGVADITPAVPCALAGFGARSAPADRVTDPLEVRALLVEAGDAAVCLLSFDSLGLDDATADLIVGSVADALGLGVTSVLPTATHTHSAPCAMALGAALGWPIPEGYLAHLASAAVTAARTAHDGRLEAVWSWASGPLPTGVAHNRRGTPMPPPTGYRLRAHTPDGSTIATVVNLGIHPVVLGPAWSGVSTDFVGPLRRALDAAIGGSALVLQHGLGDVNPLDTPEALDVLHARDPLPAAEELGATLAAAIGSWSERPLSPRRPGLTRTVRTITPERSALADLAPDPREVPFVRGDLGGIELVAVPGEPFASVDTALRADGAPRIVAALGPSWHGYLPSPFAEGYEETVSLGSPAVAVMLRTLLDA